MNAISRVIGRRWLLVVSLLASACSQGEGAPSRKGGTSDAGASGGGAGGSGGSSTAAGAGGGSTAGTGGSGAAGGSSVPDAAALDAPGLRDTIEADATDAGSGSPDAVGRGRHVLLVVGNENGTSVRGEGIGDKFLKARLESVLGHRVTVAGDNLAPGELRAAADRADLVIVSESVGSAMLQGKLKPVTTAILNYEAFIQDEMGLTPPGPPGDPGEPANFALGVKANETRIDIVAPKHPLAAGLTGTVAVYRLPRSITWGKVADTAEVVATLPGDRAGVATYVYRQGARLQDGTTAAGLRVGFFLEDDDTAGTANILTDDGLRLLDAAVAFALAPIAPPSAP